MAEFVGCWKSDSSKHQNFDEFAKVSGIPADMVEKFRTAESTIEFKRDGDNWTCNFKSNISPDRTYNFKLGQEITTTDPFGKGCKFTMDVVSDTKMTEVTSSEMMGWKTVKVTREVKGNTMICVHELDGVTMTSEMTRC